MEIVNKELLKYEVENIRWWYMTEHGKQYNNISQSRRKGPSSGENGPIIWQSRFTLVLLQVAFYVKARLCKS